VTDVLEREEQIKTCSSYCFFPLQKMVDKGVAKEIFVVFSSVEHFDYFS
jgi:hypothetical protein